MVFQDIRILNKGRLSLRGAVTIQKGTPSYLCTIARMNVNGLVLHEESPVFANSYIHDLFARNLGSREVSGTLIRDRRFDLYGFMSRNYSSVIIPRFDSPEERDGFSDELGSLLSEITDIPQCDLCAEDLMTCYSVAREEWGNRADGSWEAENKKSLVLLKDRIQMSDGRVRVL